MASKKFEAFFILGWSKRNYQPILIGLVNRNLNLLNKDVCIFSGHGVSCRVCTERGCNIC